MSGFGYKNINFMVFEYFDVILDFLESEIVRQIRLKPFLNLSIESRVEFLDLFNKLKESYDDGKVSFSNMNFFMTDDFVFDLSNWENFYPNSTSPILFDKFFDKVNFNKNNFHPIISKNRFQLLKSSNGVSSYDAEIDANNGIDVLIIKLQSDGSLIFNDIVSQNDLVSKVIYSQNNFKEKIRYEFSLNSDLPVACATLGIDQILKSKKIYLVAYGTEASNAIQKLFYTKDYDKNIPACLLKNHPNVTVLMDKDASVGIFQPSNTTFVSNYPTTNVQLTTETYEEPQVVDQPQFVVDEAVYEEQIQPNEMVVQQDYNNVVELPALDQPSVLVEYSNPNAENNEIVDSNFDSFETPDNMTFDDELS